MRIGVREISGVAILDLKGNIDINASAFIETTGWVLKYKSKDLICNFKEINLVDYIGISIIAVVYKNVLNHKGRMKICNVPSHLKNLFSIVGLNRVFTYYDSEQKAIRNLQEDAKIYEILKRKLRRRFRRIPFRTTIEYKQKFSPGKTFYKGKILNLSAIGIFMVAKKIFSIGEILDTRINLRPEPGIIEVDTKVVWVADRQIQPLEYPAMGLEFYNIDSDKQEKIGGFIDKHLTHSYTDEF
ncbi:MAG: PilZ domain-containing protein [Candidatus Omnitrophica bacterium]|nr:PilZ domain-containing protein [Candidatus Omnitrophota bacterium]